MDFKDLTDLPKGVLEAIEAYERIKDDPNYQMEAVSKQIAILDYLQVIEDATNRGKAENNIAIAKNCKNLGVNSDIIAQATGLDLETIEKL